MKRAQARKKQRHQAIFGSDSPDRVEAFLDLSCEEGEETASSEVEIKPEAKMHFLNLRWIIAYLILNMYV